MATIPVNDTEPRDQYTASASQDTFTYSFIIFDEADLDVYVDDTLKTITTDYTVTGVDDPNGGTVVFVTPMSGGEIITIEGNIAIERLTDFQQGGQFDPDILNEEQDKQVAMMKQIKRDIDRKIGLSTTSTVDASGIVLPDPVSDRLLGWNSGATGLENKTNGATATLPTIGGGDANTVVQINAGGTDYEYGKITTDNIADGTDGELITWDASGVAATVAAGTSGQVLTSNGAGAAPTFQTNTPTGLTLLATATASASASVEFTSNIDDTYDEYIFVYNNVIPATASAYLVMTASTDGGSTYLAGTNYLYVYGYGASNGTSFNADWSAGAAFVRLEVASLAGGTLSSNGEVLLTTPSNTTNSKNVTFKTTGHISTTLLRTHTGSGSITTTSAVNAIKFAMSSGNIASGEFKLYGVRKS